MSEISNVNKKDRHHFVPQFYLRYFGATERSINLLNIKGCRAVPNASIRGQCQRHKFYGQENDLEDVFASFEGEIALIINEIVKSHQLPALGSREHRHLLKFVALQRQRTTGAVARIERYMNALFDNFGESFDRSKIDIAKLGSTKDKIEIEDAVLIAIQSAELYARGIDDLELHLVIANNPQRFITSDHPIFDYNLYCEKIRGHGVLGSTCRGIQIFIPLSPKVLLVLYDPAVYKAGGTRRANITTMVADSDVHALNNLQLIGAYENVYFSEWKDQDYLLRQRNIIQKKRELVRSQVDEFMEVGSEKRFSLLKMYDPMPNLGLALSFISIRKNAKNKSMGERIKPRRSDILDELSRKFPLPNPLNDGEIHIFKRPVKSI